MNMEVLWMDSVLEFNYFYYFKECDIFYFNKGSVCEVWNFFLSWNL